MSYDFYVVEGKKLVDYKPKAEHYVRALSRVLEKARPYIEMTYKEFYKQNPDLYKQYIYLVIKYISKLFDFDRTYTTEAIEGWFALISCIDDMIGHLTPKEFRQMFPIEKEYDGKKYSMKDYFSVMEYMSQLSDDEPIGKDKVAELLFAYQNWNINFYMVAWMGIVNRMHQAQGGKDITLEFFEEQGIHIQTFHKEGDCMVDNETGERFKIKKPKNPMRKLFSVVE